MSDYCEHRCPACGKVFEYFKWEDEITCPECGLMEEWHGWVRVDKKEEEKTSLSALVQELYAVHKRIFAEIMELPKAMQECSCEPPVEETVELIQYDRGGHPDYGMVNKYCMKCGGLLRTRFLDKGR